jgi:hypothetical protein
MPAFEVSAGGLSFGLGIEDREVLEVALAAR